MIGSKCCYGYIRVSTTIQVIEGASLEEQEKKIRAWAELNDMKLMGMYVDAGVSGTFMFERPEFSRLMKHIDRGDVLVATDMSRVSRNPRDTAELIDRLEKMGAYAVFIKDGFNTSTMMGQAMAHISAVMKRIEANYTSERVKESYLSNKAEGRASGRPPYGWKRASEVKGCGWVEVPEQQAVIALIRKYRDEDRMTINAIMNKLNSDGIPSPGKGKQGWCVQTVKSVYERKEVMTKGRYDP
jgi:site-specific DNA recombinase